MNRGKSKMTVNESDWDGLSAEDKKRKLYLRQKHTLDTFLEHGAITKSQYDKSLGDLTDKMGMAEVLKQILNNSL